MFCIDKNECKGCNLYGINCLYLLDAINKIPNSLIIFDDMGENIRLLNTDSLCSRGRHLNNEIICVCYRVTDLKTKTKGKTPIANITLNGSQQFFDREQEKFK